MRRKNGDGSVYKLSGKRRKPWVARLTIGWDFNEEKQKSFPVYKFIGYYKTKEEAEMALDGEEWGSYVYFCTDGEFVKIGKSDCPERRIKHLQTGHPKKLYLMKSILTDSPKEAYNLERFFHDLLSDVQAEGEWYHLTQNLQNLTS